MPPKGVEADGKAKREGKVRAEERGNAERFRRWRGDTNEDDDEEASTANAQRGTAIAIASKL